METAVKENRVNIAIANTQTHKNSFSAWLQEAESARFAIIPILLVVIVCLGGVATAFGAASDTFQLALIVFPTITALAFTLAVAPMKLIFWVSAISVLCDIAVFLM